MSIPNPIVRAAVRCAQEAVYLEPDPYYDGSKMVLVPRAQMDNLRKQIEMDLEKQAIWKRMRS